MENVGCIGEVDMIIFRCGCSASRNALTVGKMCQNLRLLLLPSLDPPGGPLPKTFIFHCAIYHTISHTQQRQCKQPNYSILIIIKSTRMFGALIYKYRIRGVTHQEHF